MQHTTTRLKASYTTRLLADTARAANLDVTGWRALILLIAIAALCALVQMRPSPRPFTANVEAAAPQGVIIYATAQPVPTQPAPARAIEPTAEPLMLPTIAPTAAPVVLPPLPPAVVAPETWHAPAVVAPPTAEIVPEPEAAPVTNWPKGSKPNTRTLPPK